MSRFHRLIVLHAVILAACGTPVTPGPAPVPEAHTAISNSRTLMVFAASSLTGAFAELGKAFEAAHPGVTVTFNFGGSQALRTQIEQGAPADVFASASSDDMNMLISEGYIDQSASHIFLTNKLVIVLPSGNPAALEKIEDLAKPGLKLVLAAADVPVGKYAHQALTNMNAQYGINFSERVLANVVSNEDNVKQVVAKVQLGEADAGIVYASDAVAAPELKRIEITADLNVIASYPIAALRKATNPDLGAGFVGQVLAPEAQATLARWGFGAIQ
jgi:molybdate transport system substrate-binding protein